MGSYLAKTAGSIGESVGSKMAEKQKEMAEMQKANQRKMMEEQMRKQLSLQMSATRERLNWQFGTYGGFASVLLLAKMAGKAVPHAAAVPLVISPIIMAYQVDFAYGNKSDRIKEEADRILAEEEHWFTKTK